MPDASVGCAEERRSAGRLVEVRTLSVATGLVGVGRGGLHAKHGSLVSSRTNRGWFAGLSDSRLVGLARPLVAWHRSSSPRIKYEHKNHTDMNRQ